MCHHTLISKKLCSNYFSNGAIIPHPRFDIIFVNAVLYKLDLGEELSEEGYVIVGIVILHIMHIINSQNSLLSRQNEMLPVICRAHGIENLGDTLSKNPGVISVADVLDVDAS